MATAAILVAAVAFVVLLEAAGMCLVATLVSFQIRRLPTANAFPASARPPPGERIVHTSADPITRLTATRIAAITQAATVSLPVTICRRLWLRTSTASSRKISTMRRT